MKKLTKKTLTLKAGTEYVYIPFKVVGKDKDFVLGIMDAKVKPKDFKHQSTDKINIQMKDKQFLALIMSKETARILYDLLSQISRYL